MTNTQRGGLQAHPTRGVIWMGFNQSSVHPFLTHLLRTTCEGVALHGRSLRGPVSQGNSQGWRVLIHHNLIDFTWAVPLHVIEEDGSAYAYMKNSIYAKEIIFTLYCVHTLVPLLKVKAATLVRNHEVHLLDVLELLIRCNDPHRQMEFVQLSQNWRCSNFMDYGKKNWPQHQ